MADDDVQSGSKPKKFTVVTVNKSVATPGDTVTATATRYQGDASDESTWTQVTDETVSVYYSDRESQTGQGTATLTHTVDDRDAGSTIYFGGGPGPDKDGNSFPTSPGVAILGLKGGADLWYFNGATPKNFTVSSSLSVEPAASVSASSFDWEVSKGADKVQLVDSSGAKSSSLTTQSRTVKIVSIGQSGQRDDVLVKCTFGGTTVQKTLTVFYPTKGFSAVPQRNANPPAVGGYWTLFKWSVRDQFGTPITKKIEQHEILSNKTKLWGSNHYNWKMPTSASGWTGGSNESPDTLPDTWSVPIGFDFPKTAPIPVGPNDTGAGKNVDSIDQKIYVGSKESGQGVLIIERTVVRHLGYAEESN